MLLLECSYPLAHWVKLYNDYYSSQASTWNVLFDWYHSIWSCHECTKAGSNLFCALVKLDQYLWVRSFKRTSTTTLYLEGVAAKLPFLLYHSQFSLETRHHSPRSQHRVPLLNQRSSDLASCLIQRRVRRKCVQHFTQCYWLESPVGWPLDVCPDENDWWCRVVGNIQRNVSNSS